MVHLLKLALNSYPLRLENINYFDLSSIPKH